MATCTEDDDDDESQLAGLVSARLHNRRSVLSARAGHPGRPRIRLAVFLKGNGTYFSNLEGARDPIVRLKFGAGVSLHAKMANERPAPPAASLP